MEPRAAQPYKSPERHSEARERQAFYRPHTSIGAAGHWIRTAGILAPLLIGEMVKDPDRRWRWIRIASVATALLSEGLYTHRIQQERREREYERRR